MTLQDSPTLTADELADQIELQMAAIVAQLEEWRRVSGHGRVDVGFGTRPAIVVIDLARFWTEDHYDAYSKGSADAVVRVNELLVTARAAGIPVIFTTQAYQSQERGLVSATGMARKFPGSHRLAVGSREVELHPDLEVQPGEHLLTKTQSSAFAHTHLASMLHDAGVDTVLLTGVVTSGCVRATAADSLANGFRTVIVRECVSDLLPGATEWTLFDVTTKIGDVVSLAEAQDYLAGVGQLSREA